jgi:hypothetical protein
MLHYTRLKRLSGGQTLAYGSIEHFLSKVEHFLIKVGHFLSRVEHFLIKVEQFSY